MSVFGCQLPSLTITPDRAQSAHRMEGNRRSTRPNVRGAGCDPGSRRRSRTPRRAGSVVSHLERHNDTTTQRHNDQGTVSCLARGVGQLSPWTWAWPVCSRWVIAGSSTGAAPGPAPRRLLHFPTRTPAGDRSDEHRPRVLPPKDESGTGPRGAARALSRGVVPFLPATPVPIRWRGATTYAMCALWCRRFPVECAPPRHRVTVRSRRGRGRVGKSVGGAQARYAVSPTQIRALPA